MPKPRRTLAAALAIGVSAVVLTGCFPVPPALPEAPPVQTVDPSPTSDPTAAPTDPAPTGEDATEAPTGDYPFTVDDQAGDVWSFDVTGIVADPPLESGEAEEGTFFVGVLLSGEHVEGTYSFKDVFDIFVKGTDGQTYDWRDTIGVTAENDIYYADDTAFSDVVAAVQLPGGVEPAQVILRSTYGHPEVPDTVIDVN